MIRKLEFEWDADDLVAPQVHDDNDAFRAKVKDLVSNNRIEYKFCRSTAGSKGADIEYFYGFTLNCKDTESTMELILIGRTFVGNMDFGERGRECAYCMFVTYLSEKEALDGVKEFLSLC